MGDRLDRLFQEWHHLGGGGVAGRGGHDHVSPQL